MSNLDFEAAVERTMELIEESDEIHPHNKQQLAEYKRDLSLDGLSEATIQKRMAHLKVVAERIGDRRFDDLSTDDLKALVEWLQARDTTESTVEGYKKIIRFFWKWLTDGDEYPDEVAWISPKRNHSNGTLPQDLLTKEEVERQIAAAQNPRDKALIAVLWETGARIGELLDLTVGDIEDRKHGKKIVIDGKTGPRRLPLVESVPHINTWLNQHPAPEADAPLWCKLRLSDGEAEPIEYNYIRLKVLQKTAEKAAIDKPVNPHHYRHSRASDLASELKEAQLCEWFGWVQGSDVPSKYVHLSGRDIDDTYDAMHGLYDPTEEDDEPSVRECWRCEELNEPSASFCSRCGAALDRETADEVAVAQEQTTEAADQDDVELAVQLVQAMRSDRDRVETFVEDLME